MRTTRIIAAALSAALLCGCAAKPGDDNNTSEAPETTVSSETHETEAQPTAEAEYVMGERDENGVYTAQGYAAKLNFPLDEDSVVYAADRFGFVYEQYLKGKCENVYVSIVPDKNYFLAEENGYPALDYARMTELLTGKMEYAKYIDIFPLLELSDYYRTDTHWRQEKITDIAAYIAAEMGVTLSAEYNEAALEAPFYGIHCRQADISAVEPDELVYLHNEQLSQCRVYDAETDSYLDVYNMELAAGDDPYEIFLSGAKSLLTIENPDAATEKELIVFRDSYACSIAPLWAEGYSKITLVDIRYLFPDLLGRFIDFNGQDVLFLYSTLVLNNSITIK